MPKPVNLVIMVEPVAKGRARATVINGHVREYTPAKTRNAEVEIRISIRDNILHALQWDHEAGPYFPARMPLKLEVMFVIPRPPSALKKRHFPVTRPDIDNFLKTLFDACNQFLWVDDSQLVTILAKKRYGLMPAIHLRVEEEVEGSGLPVSANKLSEIDSRGNGRHSSGVLSGEKAML